MNSAIVSIVHGTIPTDCAINGFIQFNELPGTNLIAKHHTVKAKKMSVWPDPELVNKKLIKKLKRNYTNEKHF